MCQSKFLETRRPFSAFCNKPGLCKRSRHRGWSRDIRYKIRVGRRTGSGPRQRPAGKRGGAPQRGRRAKHRRNLFDSDDDSGPGGSEEDGDPRTPRDPQLRAGEAAAESRADREPCRDMEDSDASPRKVPRQAYGEGPGRKRSGPPSKLYIIYTFARAGVVIGRTACCRPPPSPSIRSRGQGV